MKLYLLLLSILLLGCCGLLDMHTICEQTSDPALRDRCMSSLALSDRNITKCGEVKNLTTKEYCMMKIAIITLDEAECEHMETSLTDQCKKVVGRIKINNSLACAGIADNETAEVCRIRVG